MFISGIEYNFYLDRYLKPQISLSFPDTSADTLEPAQVFFLRGAAGGPSGGGS